MNTTKYKGKAYVGTISGMIFDVGVHDESLSSVHVIDTFVGKYEKSVTEGVVWDLQELKLTTYRQKF